MNNKKRICPDCNVNCLDKGYRYCSECVCARKDIVQYIGQHKYLQSEKYRKARKLYLENNKEKVREWSRKSANKRYHKSDENKRKTKEYVMTRRNKIREKTPV